MNNPGFELLGSTLTVTAEFTRPSDTTAYAVKDIVSNSTSATTLMTFSNVARIAGQGGYITKVNVTTDQKANVAQFRLYFYSVSNPTIAVDNSPSLLLYADRATRIGYIDLPLMSTEDSTNSDCAMTQDNSSRIPFKCASDSTSIYAVLETLTAFTPASGQKFYVKLTIERN